MKNKNKFDDAHTSFDLNTEVLFLPYDRLSPFFYIGTGLGATSSYESPYFKLQSGLGVEYLATDNFGIRMLGEINLTQSDKIDNIISGIRDDNYWRFFISVNYYFPKRKYDEKAIKKHVKDLSIEATSNTKK
jgi:curli production assembly/transport component CsgG